MAPNMNQAMLQTLLASDTVRFVGEPVAAVVTEEMYQGEDAIELVDVDYDFLPAVVDMNDALSGETGLLFPDGRDQRGLHVRRRRPRPTPTCSTAARWWSARSSRTGGSRRPRWSPGPAAAVWGEDGRLTAWIPNQGAQGTKGALVGALGVTPDVVRIITPDVGGGFGAKFGVDAEAGRHLLDREAAGPPGAVVGDPDGEPGRHDPRPGAAAEDHHRRHEGRHRPRLPDRDPAGLRRVPEGRARSCRR